MILIFHGLEMFDGLEMLMLSSKKSQNGELSLRSGESFGLLYHHFFLRQLYLILREQMGASKDAHSCKLQLTPLHSIFTTVKAQKRFI